MNEERDRPENDPTRPPDLQRGHPEGVPIQVAEPRRSRLRRVLRMLLVAFVGYYVLCILLLVVYRFVMPPTTGVQAQRRVEAVLSGREYSKQHEIVSMDDLPAHVGRAVVAAEDGRFWSHSGFDWEEMRIARRESNGGTRMRGASTISQQLMKNLFATTHRNPIRKVYDLALTPPAELILGKGRILEIYLNQVEWGDGIYGVERAAQHHYGVSAANLSRTQAAGLAALLPNPRGRTPANTGGYRSNILNRMSQRGW